MPTVSEKLALAQCVDSEVASVINSEPPWISVLKAQGLHTETYDIA